ncbi:MAG: hypothetical protein CMK83_16370 [Pseudomonadales bacterium]|nr:hypothetical protein [Pseudomonadales bacterium]MBI28118.1 hypothetical protein [Pseudomonadales bacterium]HAG95094.1 hypothetical protein [Gammaproteobacteria bacterium]HAU12534.1 hypothetical protein [Gammaproteobacteria bacterium]|tara:strand:- start:2347 stop:3450 length:1104 start_codon:yes stop_codon:yes gene_type:complete
MSPKFELTCGDSGTNTFLLLLVLTGGLILTANHAHAVDIGFSGFGTVAAGKVTSEADPPVLVDPVSGAEYDNAIRFEPESLIALRAVSEVNDQVTATIQVIGKGAESSDADIEWAYATYRLSAETVFNAGRFRLPLFYYSDFLDAAYAYHWIRPPVDVYSIPASTLTGVNIFNTHYFHNVGLTTQIWYGAEEKEDDEVVADITKSQGINVILDYEWLRLRAVYHTIRISLDVKPILVSSAGGLIQLDPEPSEGKVEYIALGFMADYGSLLWRSEFTHIDSVLNVDTEITGYASLGYMIGRFTPHYTYSFRDASPDTETHTVGVRWDFKQAAALKVEYSNSYQDGRDETPPTGESRTEFISMALDFVF